MHIVRIYLFIYSNPQGRFVTAIDLLGLSGLDQSSCIRTAPTLQSHRTRLQRVRARQVARENIRESLCSAAPRVLGWWRIWASSRTPWLSSLVQKSSRMRLKQSSCVFEPKLDDVLQRSIIDTSPQSVHPVVAAVACLVNTATALFY